MTTATVTLTTQQMDVIEHALDTYIRQQAQARQEYPKDSKGWRHHHTNLATAIAACDQIEAAR